MTLIDIYRNALGFFIQFFPCVLLFILALDQDELKFNKKYVIGGFFAFSVVSAIIFSFLLNYIQSTQITGTQLGNIYMLIVMLIGLVVIQFLSYGDIIKKLLIACLVLFYATTIYMLSNFIYIFFAKHEAFYVDQLYDPIMFTLFLVLTIVLLPPSALFMKNIVLPHLKDTSLVELKREFKLSIFIILMYFIGLVSFITNGSIFNYGVWGAETAFLVAYSSLICVVAFALVFWLLFFELRRIREESMVKHQILIQQVQYKKINHEIENARHVRHDIRHHLRMIQTFINNGNDDKALEYIRVVNEDILSFDEFQYCDNFTINTLLCYYINWAKNRGIDCTVRVKCGDISITDSDLTILLGNCLENAIFSCEHTDEKKIVLKIGVIGSTLAIVLINTCNEVHLKNEQNKDEYASVNSFISIRSSGSGLKSMEHTAKKYGGTVKCRFDNDKKEFITKIILYLNHSKSD